MSSSIEEYFEPPEWATKDEVIKVAKHYINYWRIEAKSAHARANDAEGRIADLKAENERLRASSFVTAVPSEDYEKLKAEVERLEINDYKNLSMRIEIDKLNAKINRLVKAGDKMVLCIDGDYNYQMPCVQAWNAAKEGKPSV